MSHDEQGRGLAEPMGQEDAQKLLSLADGGSPAYNFSHVNLSKITDAASASMKR
jgi:hypothetical protein